MTRALALMLTIFTGFTGLVYQVTWQKYLATLLGSHSEATAAVLGIFLGGLSVGYSLFGSVTERLMARSTDAKPARLLVVYGVIEAGIGLYAILFPWLFRLAQSVSFVLPHSNPGVGFFFDVVLSALLIGPPAVMMGATVPILTQALSRSITDATRFHAFVYGLNTVGAFAGALWAGFYIVPRWGLDGALYVMGFVNVVAGGIYAGLDYVKRGPGLVTQPASASSPADVAGARPYLIVALLTGFAMMTLETTLIRLAGLSFGSSQFTFSMVVAAFVLCIALGALAVSFFDRIPKQALLVDLWALVAVLVALYFLLPQAPYWVHVLRSAFSESDAAFYGYYAAGFALMLLAVGLPVMLSGALLPLVFHYLRSQFGELGALAGQLYSWNTVGSLLGALVGGYALFFWFDLHEIYRFAVAAVLVSAAMMTATIAGKRPAALGSGLVCLVALVLLPAWSSTLLQMGLFRESQFPPDLYQGYAAYHARYVAPNDRSVLFYEDDPTVSVSVRNFTEFDGRESRSIIVNGKSDSNTLHDRTTLNLLGILPSLLADSNERAFIVGWGTGVTVGELARIEGVEEIVAAEISSSVMKADRHFEGFNLKALKQPEVRIVRSDAYRALRRSDEPFDLIISEPSNPWVTGVEMLYSEEFLGLARERLSEGGVFAQWFHTYETDDRSLQLILRTFNRVFEHTSVWQAASRDLIILGFRRRGPAIDYHRLVDRTGRSDYRASLLRAGIGGPGELLAKELLPVDTWPAAGFEGPIHTLYHPLLNDAAGRAFFRRDSAILPFTGFGEAARVGERNALLRRHFAAARGGLDDEERADIIEQASRQSRGYAVTLLADWMREDPSGEAFERARSAAVGWLERNDPEGDPHRTIELLGRLFEPDSSVETTTESAWELTELYADFYYHAAPFDPAAIEAAWAGCRERSKTREACEGEISPDSEKGLALRREGAGSVEAYVRACMGERFAGPVCREGTEFARQVLAGDTSRVRRLNPRLRD